MAEQNFRCAHCSTGSPEISGLVRSNGLNLDGVVFNPSGSIFHLLKFRSVYSFIFN